MCGCTYIQVFYRFVKINTGPNWCWFYDKIANLGYLSNNFPEHVENIL